MAPRRPPCRTTAATGVQLLRTSTHLHVALKCGPAAPSTAAPRTLPAAHHPAGPHGRGWPSVSQPSPRSRQPSLLCLWVASAHASRTCVCTRPDVCVHPGPEAKSPMSTPRPELPNGEGRKPELCGHRPAIQEGVRTSRAFPPTNRHPGPDSGHYHGRRPLPGPAVVQVDVTAGVGRREGGRGTCWTLVSGLCWTG